MKATAFSVTMAISTCLFLSLAFGGEDPKFTKAEIRSLIHRLGSKEPADAGIHHEIAMAGSQAVSSLINALSSRDSWTRRRAAQSLGLIGDSTAVPALVKMARRKAGARAATE